MRNLKDKFVIGFFSCLCLLVVLAVWAPLHAQSDTSYGISEAKNVMVAMRDGVKLAADIYRPTQNGQPIDNKFPVILMRTPYNKDDDAPIVNSFVPHGYVVVLEDVRGRYKSEGHWYPVIDDPNDGFDTAKWIGSQPWCDGGIGTIFWTVAFGNKRPRFQKSRGSSVRPGAWRLQRRWVRPRNVDAAFF